jgi:hypothetical protein
MEVDQLAYDASQRTLDKQERVVEELRARTGVLLAAAGLAVSLLGGMALQRDGSRGLVAIALVTFVVTILACLRTLSPAPELRFTLSSGAVLRRRDSGLSGTGLEIQLVHDLERIADRNLAIIVRLRRSYRLAAGAFSVQLLLYATVTTWSIL